MPSIQHQDYKGYAIVAMATPASGGKYHSIFSVTQANQLNQEDQPPVAHQEKVTENPKFATEAEAIDAAHECAKSWIEAHAK
jgi:hypothetical protein